MNPVSVFRNNPYQTAPRAEEQPVDDIFVAKITAVEASPVRGFFAHAWEEQLFSVTSRDYVTSDIGRSGSLTVAPALDPNGGSFPVGTFVYLRLRGWVNTEATPTETGPSLDTIQSGLVYDIMGSTSASSVETVLILAIVASQTNISGSTCESGSGSGAGSTCPSIFHQAVIQTYDPLCDQWSNGECVYVIDVEGRRMEIGRRYAATQNGVAPPFLSAIIQPVGSPCTFTGGEPLYLADIGDPTRTIMVEREVGTLCNVSGSDSYSASGGTDENNLRVYEGMAQRWDSLTCTWEVIEDPVYVAEMHGCPLVIGRRYAGHYERQVREGEASGSTSSEVRECTALYLVDENVRPPQGVADIRCVNGIIKVYVWQATDDCGGVQAVFSHNAGCCDCGSGSNSDSTGSGTGGGPSDICGCTVSPATWTAEVVGVTTPPGPACTSGDCTDWNKVHTLPYLGGGSWGVGIPVVVCGTTGGLGTTLLCDETDFILSFSGFAIYKKSRASWACLGSNVMTLFWSAPECSNWPGTVTVVPA